MYQLLLVATTEGSMFHVIVTASDCDGRTTVKCGEYNSNAEHSYLVLPLSVLHHLLVTRLYDYFVTTRIRDWISSKIYTEVNTTHEDERRTLRQLCKRLYGHKIARRHSKAQRRIPHPYKDSGDQRHRTQTYMNSSVLRPLEIEVGSPCSRPLTYPWNRWLPPARRASESVGAGRPTTGIQL